MASREGYLNILKFLITCTTYDISQYNEALLEAVQNNTNVEVTKWLISKGASNWIEALEKATEHSNI